MPYSAKISAKFLSPTVTLEIKYLINQSSNQQIQNNLPIQRSFKEEFNLILINLMESHKKNVEYKRAGRITGDKIGKEREGTKPEHDKLR